MQEICDQVISLYKDHLTSLAGKDEIQAKVHFMKLHGDYNRYLAEIHTDRHRDDAINNAMTIYKEALTLAQELPPTNEIRLGLALN